MAESDGQERTEQPTGKRLSDAKEKGQVARSRELSTALVLLAAAVGLLVFGKMVVENLERVMRSSFSVDKAVLFNETLGIQLFLESIESSLISLIPLMLLIVVAAIYGSTAMSGWSFSLDAVSFKFEKLNPISGIKKILSLNGLMEAGKAFLKFIFVGSIGVAILWINFDDLLNLGNFSIEGAMSASVHKLSWIFLLASLSMILLAAIDVPYQAWYFRRQLRMTREEIRQEQKQTDGSPEIKQRVRRVQMQIAMQRMMQNVPKADVVITNPTHFSVAIKYDQSKMRAPVVVAKGADFVALQIRKVAQSANVPILSAPPLARAIYHHTELDQEIPEGLYVAVAQVLAYIYYLRKHGFRNAKQDMGDLPIPDEYVTPEPNIDEE